MTLTLCKLNNSFYQTSFWIGTHFCFSRNSCLQMNSYLWLKFPEQKQSLDPPSSVQVEEEWSWKKTDQHTAKDQKSLRKTELKKRQCWFCSSTAHHTATGFTQWDYFLCFFHSWSSTHANVFDLIGYRNTSVLNTTPQLAPVVGHALFSGDLFFEKGPVWIYARCVGKEKETRMYCKILFSFK